eukprot:gene8308-1579_t
MGKDLKIACQEAATASSTLFKRLDLEKSLGMNYEDVKMVHSVFGSACYIDSSFPSVLYLAYKYSDDFEKAVLSNTNVGGENCHRGAALGALVGAAVGESGIPRRFIEGLHDSANIKMDEAIGGENCHRGSALGAVLGAAEGELGIPRQFIESLHDSPNIKKEIDAFVVALYPDETCAGKA